MSNQQDTLRRAALYYHLQPNRGSSCGSMAIDMDLILSGLVEIGKDSRLYVTDAGRALLAQGIEAATAGETTQIGSTEGESPVAESDAPVTDLSSPASRED